MKKMLCLVTLLCLMAFPALAQQDTQTLVQGYLSPPGAQLLSQEQDDGLMEYDCGWPTAGNL